MLRIDANYDFGELANDMALLIADVPRRMQPSRGRREVRHKAGLRRVLCVSPSVALVGMITATATALWSTAALRSTTTASTRGVIAAATAWSVIDPVSGTGTTAASGTAEDALVGTMIAARLSIIGSSLIMASAIIWSTMALPSLSAAVAEATPRGIAAPIPAGAVPAIEIPAVTMAAE